MTPPMTGPFHQGGHPVGHLTQQQPAGLAQQPRGAPSALQGQAAGGYPPPPSSDQHQHAQSYGPPPWHQQHHHHQSSHQQPPHPQHHHHHHHQQQQHGHGHGHGPLAHPGHGHHPPPHPHHRQPLSLTGQAPIHTHGYYGQGPGSAPLTSPGAMSAPASMGPPGPAAGSPSYYPPHAPGRHAGSLPPPYLHPPPHSGSTSSSNSVLSLPQPISGVSHNAYPPIPNALRTGRASSIPTDAPYRSPPPAGCDVQAPLSAPASAPPARPRLLSPGTGALAGPESSSFSSSQAASADQCNTAEQARSTASSSSASTPTAAQGARAIESVSEDTVDVNVNVTTAASPNSSAVGRNLRARRTSSTAPLASDVRKRSSASRSPTRSNARRQSGSRAASKDPVAAGRTRQSLSDAGGLEDVNSEMADEQGQGVLTVDGDDHAAGPSGRSGRTRASGRRAAATANAASAGDSPAASSSLLPDIAAPDQSSELGPVGASDALAHLAGTIATNEGPSGPVFGGAHDVGSPTLGTTGYNLEVVCRREPYMYFVASNYTEVTSRNLKKRTAADISAIHVDDRAGAIWVCFDIQRVYSEYDNLTMPCKQSLCSLFRRALEGPDGPDAGTTIHGWAAITEEASDVVRKTGDMVLARDLNRKVVPRKTGYVMVLDSAAASPVIPSAVTRRNRVNSRSPSPEIITSYKRRRLSGERSTASGSTNEHQNQHHGQSHSHSTTTRVSSAAYHPYSRSSPPPRSINPPLDPTAAFVMPPDTSIDYTQVLANEFSATLKRVSADIHLKYTELRNICTALHAENNELRSANGAAPDTAIQELTAAKARIAKLEHENAMLEAKVREQAATIDRVRKTLWAAGNKPDI